MTWSSALGTHDGGVSEVSVTPSGLVLGGRLRPAGVVVSFLRAPFGAVAAHLHQWREGLGQRVVSRDSRFSDLVSDLEPFEAPWTREVVFDCGEWTAYMNNERHGGDPTAAAPYLATSMAVDCFVAVNAPSYGAGHQQTSLQILGPGGEPPLRYVRSILADCADGRWSWHATGAVQPFEKLERYSHRTIRERFDR